MFATLVLVVGCSAGRMKESVSAPAPATDPSADIEIESLQEFQARNGQLSGYVIQGVDLRAVPLRDIEKATVTGAILLGAQLTPAQARALREHGATVVDPPPQYSFNAYRNALYTQAELDTPPAQNEMTLDERIYKEYEAGGRLPKHALQSQARSLHDDAIEDALQEYLIEACPPATCKGAVGIMGGASEPRHTADYRETARIGWALARAGYFVVTGGGTGMMEAGNLGAFLSQATEQELDAAIARLATKPKYNPESSDGYTVAEYKQVARDVREDAKAPTPSLGVPTWFYGHEPTNAFATDVAKYFSNGIREDRLLQISSRGLVIVKGSAGTRQEIFMEAAQEHYATYDQCSPVVFVGTPFASELEVVRTAAEKAASHPKPEKRTYYKDVLKTAKTPQDVVKALDDTPPIEANKYHLCPQTPPKSSSTPISALARTFRASYDSAIERHAAKMRASYPIVTQDLLNMTLLRPGAAPEPFTTMAKRTYFLVAHTSHPPLTIYSILSKQGFGDLNDATVAELTSYRDQLKQAVDSDKTGDGVEPNLRARLFPIMKASLRYLEESIARRSATRQSFENYARPLRETIRGNFQIAAQEQLTQFKAKMDAWQAAYPNENWSALRVVVMGGHQARDLYALKLFFQWLLREPGYEKRVVYAEDQTMPVGLDLPSAEVSGLELLTKVDFDNDVGQIIFGDPSIMQRDVIGPAAQSILKEWGPTQWP